MSEVLLGFCIGFVFASALWLSVFGVEVNMETYLKKILTKIKKTKSKTYYKKEKTL